MILKIKNITGVGSSTGKTYFSLSTVTSNSVMVTK